MAAPVHSTYMGRLHEGLCKAMLEALKGEPIMLGEGDNQRPLRHDDGSLVMTPPKASTMKEIREFLKDNGIDKEPIPATTIPQTSVTAAVLEQFHDDDDLLLLGEQANKLLGEGS